jgi:hypothetical protein
VDYSGNPDRVLNKPRMGINQTRPGYLYIRLPNTQLVNVGQPAPTGVERVVVRNTIGARNLFWVEGPDNSDSFAGMVSHGALLKASNVVDALLRCSRSAAPYGQLPPPSGYA